MSTPSDPADAFTWALNHSNEAWWVFGAIAAGIAWTSKRLRDWNRRNAPSAAPTKARAARWTPGAPTPASPTPVPRPANAPAQPAAASAYTAATAYAASAYAAQAAYAPPPPAATTSQGGSARKLHRETPAAPVQRAAPAQRAVTPVARSVDVPVPATTGAWTLAGAFGDPAHARTAIVIAEVLGRPPGLR